MRERRRDFAPTGEPRPGRDLDGGDCTYAIMPMAAPDIDAVLDIERGSQPSPWPAKLFLGELDREWAYVDLVWAHGPDEAIVTAFCNYWLVRDEVHLLNLATHPRWRQRGMARRLMDHLVAFAGDRKCRFVTLEVRKSNQAARALYRGYGFEAVGLRPKYYAGGEDAVVMTLELEGGDASAE